MKRELELSAILSDFARTMLTDFPIEAILDHLVLRIVEILPVSAAGVTLIQPPAGPRYVAASDASALRYEELQSEIGEGPCLAAYSSGAAISVPDLDLDHRFPNFSAAARAAGCRAAFTFPLHHGDKRLGALDLYRDTVGELDTEDLAIAQTLADVTAAYLVNAQARSDLQSASDSLREISIHDALTGLPNRSLLLARLEHAVARSERSQKILALLFLDVDQFKEVNDTHGHRIGDELLVSLAARVAAELRPADTLARLSGDEFVIVLEELDNERQANEIADRVVTATRLAFTLSGVALEISVSVGIAFAGRGKNVPDQMLHDADTAMYQVKRKGGANHQVVDLREQHLSERRAALERDLRQAIPRNELRTEYQAIVRTSDGRLEAAEVLLRWEHPRLGLIAPMTLIPIAEQSELILGIGRWVLERACQDRHVLAVKEDNEMLGIAVNVSAHQLMAPDFAAMVANVLRQTGTLAARLTIEITESVFLQDAERALIVLNDLKSTGVTLELDDFGTGYSSLSYLSQFPVDIVKIDQRFIVGMKRHRASHAIVETIINLAHLIDMRAVTEGVQTKAQHAEVARMGGDYCQGYYFGRPLPLSSPAVLAKQRRFDAKDWASRASPN